MRSIIKSICNATKYLAELFVKPAPGHSLNGMNSWPPSLGLFRLIWFTWVNMTMPTRRSLMRMPHMNILTVGRPKEYCVVCRQLVSNSCFCPYSCGSDAIHLNGGLTVVGQSRNALKCATTLRESAPNSYPPSSIDSTRPSQWVMAMSSNSPVSQE